MSPGPETTEYIKQLCGELSNFSKDLLLKSLLSMLLPVMSEEEFKKFEEAVEVLK